MSLISAQLFYSCLVTNANSHNGMICLKLLVEMRQRNIKVSSSNSNLFDVRLMKCGVCRSLKTWSRECSGLSE